MVSLISKFLSGQSDDWCSRIKGPMREIEIFYKTHPDLSYKAKRRTAKERLCKLEGMTPFAAYTVLNQWDAVLREKRANSCSSTPDADRRSSNEGNDKSKHSGDRSCGVPQKGDSEGEVLLNPQWIGQTLLQAGLINPHQIEVAVADAQYREDLRFGEILAARGWIAQETADFFVEQLPYLSGEREKKPIGQYLKAAKLLDDRQIIKILSAQVIYPEKFGKLAVTKQYIKQQTLDYLMDYLPKC